MSDENREALIEEFLSDTPPYPIKESRKEVEMLSAFDLPHLREDKEKVKRYLLGEGDIGPGTKNSLTRSYGVILRDGKWTFKGRTSFFGGPRSGWSHFRLTSSDEAGGPTEHLSFWVSDWTRMGDSRVVVYRNQWDPDVCSTCAYHYCTIHMSNNHGVNGQFSMSLF